MKFALPVIACLGLFMLSACEKQGPLEEAGEKADEAIEDTRDSMEEAADSVEDAVEDAADNAG